MTDLTISKVYVQPASGWIVIWFTSSTSNPDGCNESGAAVLVPDYSTTAKTEGVRQTLASIMSAFLGGKKVDIYTPGCVTYPWGNLPDGGSYTAPGIYDIAIHN